MRHNSDLPDYHGCLNLLHAVYVLWWRDAQHNQRLLQQLADWTDQPIDQTRASRPAWFRSARKDNYLNDHLDT